MSRRSTQGTCRRVVYDGQHQHVAHRLSLLLVSPFLLSAIAGCGAGSPAAGNSVTTESRSLQVGSASRVHVELAMQPGNLQMSGGANQLMTARFTYWPSAWKPTVSYRVSNGQGKLVIHQPPLESVTNGKNTWDVALSDRVPIDLAITSGPGNATLNLRTLTLNAVAMAAGPGNVTIDAGSPSLKTLTVSSGPGNLTVSLTAAWKHNVTATINSGIGNTTLRLPATIGVRVVVQHGEGVVSASNFTQQGGAYVNAAFGHSQVAVRVTLNAGIGNVVLTPEA